MLSHLDGGRPAFPLEPAARPHQFHSRGHVHGHGHHGRGGPVAAASLAGAAKASPVRGQLEMVEELQIWNIRNSIVVFVIQSCCSSGRNKSN